MFIVNLDQNLMMNCISNRVCVKQTRVLILVIY